MNVLLLEPDRKLAGIYRQALMHDGHKVIMCASAQSAIFAADTVKPDVVILELQLIDHSGIEFLYEFRSYPEWQDIPVVIQSNVPAREFDNSWELLKTHLGVSVYHYKPLTTLKTLVASLADLSTQPA